MKMLLTGNPIKAKYAKEIGLINDYYPESDLESEVLKLAQKIASKSTKIIKIGKEAFYKQYNLSLYDAYEYTSRVMAENTLKDDAKEVINSFLEKRNPNWSDK